MPDENPKELRFEWDEQKAQANRKKHRVSFEEAQTVFNDEEALVMPDPEHSDEEERILILGLSSSLRVLMVCHCYRTDDEVIRIISARRASAQERRQYDERWGR